MNNKTAVVVLVAVGVLLGVGLLMRHNAAEEQKRKDAGQIQQLETTVTATEGKLSEQKKVNDTLTTNLATKTEEAMNLATKVDAGNLEIARGKDALSSSQAETRVAQQNVKTALLATQKAEQAAQKAEQATKQAMAATKASEAKAAADRQEAARRLAALEKSKTEEIARRDATITDLSKARDQLNEKVASLNDEINSMKQTIAGLNTKIASTERELEITKGDKEFLTRELRRMHQEKAELEEDLNNLAFLKEQIATLKSDQAIAQRVQWMRKGVFQDDRKGATILNEGFATPAASQTIHGSKLKVEVRKDGTVNITPASPEAPKAAPKTKAPPASPEPEKSVTISPNPPPAKKKK